jgi:2'-5' RNA ligase
MRHPAPVTVLLTLAPTAGRSLDVRISLTSARTTRRARHTFSVAQEDRRPTHFVALRLPDLNLRGVVRDVQAKVLNHDPSLAGCDVPAEKNHLTAFVLHCCGPSDVQRAIQALRAYERLLPSSGRAPHVYLNGLGHFGTKVLYAAAPDDNADNRKLVSLVDMCRQHFIEHDFSVQTEGWTPHLTLLKTSRVAARRRGRPPAIRPAACKGVPHEFGCHELRTMELCSMQGVADDGFYVVEAAIQLTTHEPSAA